MMAFIAGMMFGSIGATVILLFFMGAKMNDRCYECTRGQQIDKN